LLLLWSKKRLAEEKQRGLPEFLYDGIDEICVGDLCSTCGKEREVHAKYICMSW